MYEHIIHTLIMMVKNTPDNTELGAKVRAILSSMVQENNNSGKGLLKG